MAGPSIMSGMYYMASIWPALIGGVSDPRYYPPSSLLCGFNLVLPTCFYTSSSIAASCTFLSTSSRPKVCIKAQCSSMCGKCITCPCKSPFIRIRSGGTTEKTLTGPVQSRCQLSWALSINATLAGAELGLARPQLTSWTNHTEQGD